eukprot:gnl/MRDRNA2_/MRDRNA2_65295_c0_seq2.p1 gnl/MRDRNA2_/MRDRNA2_65295_c0~~gnl/MRDRNA2_/MRDRNA2_65295_c0_seq2.p1  ORF type:complete len:302 (-),score=71.49 gnl/MRDRNA2_/MRDRNA2_65295_c0_seq2:173-946(-)
MVDADWKFKLHKADDVDGNLKLDADGDLDLHFENRTHAQLQTEEDVYIDSALKGEDSKLPLDEDGDLDLHFDILHALVQSDKNSDIFSAFQNSNGKLPLDEDCDLELIRTSVKGKKKSSREGHVDFNLCNGARLSESEMIDPKEGKYVRGVGGTIEIVKQKYGGVPGQRFKVIGETGVAWQLKQGITVPKSLANEGWKWIVCEDEQNRCKFLKHKRRRLSNFADSVAPPSDQLPGTLTHESEEGDYGRRFPWCLLFG